MVDMTYCTDITMWFVSVKLFFRHLFFPHFIFFLILERVKGIEPLHPAWKASVLPLNYTRKIQTLHALYIIKVFKFGGGGKIRTFEDRSQRVYSPPHLTALVPLLTLLWGCPLT